MSSRKVNSTSKRMTPTSSGYSKMNSTVLNRRDVNSTLRTHEPSLAVTRVAPSVDWDLEVDFAYNEYLQALMMKQLIERNAKLKKTDINDQLSSKGEQFAEVQEEIDRLEEEIEKFELKPRLQQLTNAVKILVDRTADVLSSDVEKEFDKFFSVLVEARECLYVRNVKLFETEEEVNAFVKLLMECKKIMENSIKVAPNVELCQKQVCLLKEFKELEKELIHWDGNVLKLNEDSNNLILKVVSDKLTACKKINN